MQIHEFKIGLAFWCSDQQWRCTDIGSRVITAVCLSDPQIVADPSWLNGPPYAVAEVVFDENDQEGCVLTEEEL